MTGFLPPNISLAFPGFSPNNRIGEDVITFAAIQKETYQPTPLKPYQGIWVGDYSGHGCEFLLIMQWTEEELADGSRPLPRRAVEVLESRSTTSTDGNTTYVSSDLEIPLDLGSADGPVSGRLEAVKLTGDPNVPRGEYTFIAPDIGDRGTIRIAEEEMFRGARFVKSVGHIASHGFREDKFVSSQLILISNDLLAQYWECFGHVSYYKRVNPQDFSTAE